MKRTIGKLVVSKSKNHNKYLLNSLINSGQEKKSKQDENSIKCQNCQMKDSSENVSRTLNTKNA